MSDIIEVKVIQPPRLDLLVRAGKLNLKYIASRAAFYGANVLRQSAPVKTGRLRGSATWVDTGGIRSYSYQALVTGETFTDEIMSAAGEGNILATFGVSTPYARYVERYHPQYWAFAVVGTQARINNLLRTIEICRPGLLTA